MSLTDVKIRNAKARTRPFKVSDGGGLHLLIQPSGGKLWRLAYRFEGKQKTLAFGGYPSVSLAEARMKRDSARRLLAGGIDPSFQKKIDRRAAQFTAANTFKVVAEEWLDKKIRGEHAAAATLSKTEWLLGLAYPLIGSRPIADLTAAELLDVLRVLEVRGR